jgi:hypothetical protein
MSGWTITWRGNTWTDDDLTGIHLAQLAIISGDDRFESLSITEDDIRSYPSDGYMRLMFMLSTFVVTAACEGLDHSNVDEATDRTALALRTVQTATADEVLGCITFDARVPA